MKNKILKLLDEYQDKSELADKIIDLFNEDDFLNIMFDKYKTAVIWGNTGEQVYLPNIIRETFNQMKS